MKARKSVFALMVLALILVIAVAAALFTGKDRPAPAFHDDIADAADIDEPYAAPPGISIEDPEEVFEGLINEARNALSEEDYLAAESLIEKAGTINPENPEVQRLLRRIQPRISVSAELRGSDYFDALIYINGQLQPRATPATYPLERGRAYEIEVSPPPSAEGRFISAKHKLVADRPGPYVFRGLIREMPFYTDWPFDAEEAARRQNETASWLDIPVSRIIDLGDGVEIKMALIPPGEFMMGSPPAERGRIENETLRRVKITRPFYLGIYPITQRQWLQVMGDNPSRFEGEDNPVEMISWFNAREFAQKVGQGVRLPTEAEWEYACRAGAETPFYTGSAESDLGRAGWYGVNSASRTWAAGQKEANAWGLFDMHGNVFEWCDDWYAPEYYKESPLENPPGPDIGTFKICRGGGWFFPASNCRSAFRHWQTPDHRSRDVGFRVAQTIEEDFD